MNCQESSTSLYIKVTYHERLNGWNLGFCSASTCSEVKIDIQISEYQLKKFLGGEANNFMPSISSESWTLLVEKLLLQISLEELTF